MYGGHEEGGIHALQFLSNMSNEIRTPLNGINGMLEIMKEKKLVSDEHYLDMACSSARYLTRILNNVSELTRISCGQIELKPSYLMAEEVEKLIRERIEVFEKEHRITVQGGFPISIYRYAYLDGVRVAQIVAELLEDAMRRTEEGGQVSYKVTAYQVRERWLRIAFTVHDEGHHRSTAEYEHLLQPFFMNDSPREEQSDLGLAVAQGLAQLMGSQLEMTNPMTGGTDITFVIETKGQTSLEGVQANVGVAGVIQKKEELQLQNRRALIVEDNQINREIAAALLRFIGLASDSVTNGAEALNRMEQMESGYYDVIFMDIRMPVMDGLEATKAIRSLDRADTREMAIVAMTSKVSDEEEKQAQECGMDYVLAKPFDKRQLQRIIYQIFG